MSRIFAERGMRADGNILPFEKFRLFIDEKDPKFDDEKLAKVVANAEKMLEEPIPFLPASLYREFSVNGNRSLRGPLFSPPRHGVCACPCGSV